MKTTLDEQELTRWLDGEMNATELSRFEARLQADPAMRSEAEAMRLLCLQVKNHFPRIADVSHPDFFNSQIQERIGELELADRHKEEQSSPWLRWLRRPWLVLAGATALVLLIGQAVFRVDPDSDPDNATTLQNTYAPDSGIQLRTYHSKDANATVLELEGLEDIPADSDVVSFKAHHSDVNGRLAQTTLYSAQGKTMQVLAMNESSLPRIIVP